LEKELEKEKETAGRKRMVMVVSLQDGANQAGS
jgi:hypothetical protein